MPLFSVRSRATRYEGDSIADASAQVATNAAADELEFRASVILERDALIERFNAEPLAMVRAVANLVMYAKYGDRLKNFGGKTRQPPEGRPYVP